MLGCIVGPLGISHQAENALNGVVVEKKTLLSPFHLIVFLGELLFSGID